MIPVLENPTDFLYTESGFLVDEHHHEKVSRYFDKSTWYKDTRLENPVYGNLEINTRIACPIYEHQIGVESVLALPRHYILMQKRDEETHQWKDWTRIPQTPHAVWENPIVRELGKTKRLVCLGLSRENYGRYYARFLQDDRVGPGLILLGTRVTGAFCSITNRRFKQHVFDDQGRWASTEIEYLYRECMTIPFKYDSSIFWKRK